VLSIAHVNLLAESPKPMQSQGFPNLSYLIFEMIWETGVKQAVERAISVVLDLEGKLVEIYYVLRNMVSILHPEMLKLMLSISNGVVRSKGALEFSDKVDPTVHPVWTVSWITRSGSNHSRVIPFRYDWAKVTFALSRQNALA